MEVKRVFIESWVSSSARLLNLRTFTHHSTGAIEINLLNVVVVGVAPVHGTGAVVQRQAVGPQHVGGHEDASVGSVHPGFLDPPDAVIDLVLFPVCPVHPAVTNTKLSWPNRPWQHLLDDIIASKLKTEHHTGLGNDLNLLDSTWRRKQPILSGFVGFEMWFVQLFAMISSVLNMPRGCAAFKGCWRSLVAPGFSSKIEPQQRGDEMRYGGEWSLPLSYSHFDDLMYYSISRTVT